MKRRLIAALASALLGTTGLALAHDTQHSSMPSDSSASLPSESSISSDSPASLPSESSSDQSVTALERYDGDTASSGSSDVTSMPGVNPSYGQESMPSPSASESSQPATESPSLYPPSSQY